MMAGLIRWIRDHFFWVALGFMVVLIPLVDAIGILRLATARLFIWIGFAGLLLLGLAALKEQGMLSRRRQVSGEQLIRMIEERAANGAHLAIFRMISAPSQLHDRVSEIIKAQRGWEFSFYTTANPLTDRQRLAEHLEQRFLSRPLARTVFGMVGPGWWWQKDLIILAKFQSLPDARSLQSWPWLKSESQAHPNMEVLLAFEAKWSNLNPTGSDDSRKIWKVYEGNRQALGVWQRLQKGLLQAKVIAWGVCSEADWHALDIDSIRRSIIDHCALSSTMLFRKFSMDGLGQWFRSADKLALTAGFIGYMLSPFSPYNDLIVNVLPSFILASITVQFIPISLTAAMLVYYICSNLLGIMLLMWAVHRLSLDFTARLSKIQKIAIAGYIIGISLVMSLLDMEAAIKKIYEFIGP